MARRLTVEEIEDMIKGHLGAPRKPEDLKVKQKPWNEAEPEGPNVKKSLSIKEMFKK